MLADSNKTVALDFVLAHRLGAFHRMEDLADRLRWCHVVLNDFLKQYAAALQRFF